MPKNTYLTRWIEDGNIVEGSTQVLDSRDDIRTSKEDCNQAGYKFYSKRIHISTQ